jgi:anti-sigma B factor antagonist
MQIEEHKHGAVAVIKPAGPLVQPDVEALRERMLQARTQSLGRVVLDAATVSYADSRGLEILVEVAGEFARASQPLKICGANDVLREVFDLTGIDSAFEHFEDVNAAVRSFL